MTSKSLKLIDSFNIEGYPEAQSNKVAKRMRPAPYSLRLSDAEREYLKNKSGDLSLHAYIRARIFDDDAPIPSARKTPRINDMRALSKVLGGLGRSNIANNLNQIAKAIHTGTISVPDDISADLNQACKEIATMRRDLIRALGLKEQV